MDYNLASSSSEAVKKNYQKVLIRVSNLNIKKTIQYAVTQNYKIKQMSKSGTFVLY